MPPSGSLPSDSSSPVSPVPGASLGNAASFQSEPTDSSSAAPGLHGKVFWLLAALSTLHFGSLAAMLLAGQWLRGMGGTETTLGWFSAAIVPGIVLGAPLAGRWASRIPEQRLILVGVCLVGLCTALLAGFASPSWWLVPLRFMQGLGHGIVFTSLFSLAAHVIPDRHKARGIGYVALSAQLGNIGGAALADAMQAHWGFGMAFIAAAGLSFLAWGLAWCLPREVAAQAGGPRSDADVGITPRGWQVVFAVSFFAVLGGSYGTVLQLVPLMVADLAHTRAGGASASASATPVLAAIFLTVAASRLFLARYVDGPQRHPILIGVTLLMMVSCAFWPLARTVAELIAIGVVFALGYGLLFPGLNGMVLSGLNRRWRSRASGLIVMAYDGGFFGLLLLLGPLAEHGGLGAMFGVLVALQVLTGLGFIAMLRTVRRG